MYHTIPSLSMKHTGVYKKERHINHKMNKKIIVELLFITTEKICYIDKQNAQKLYVKKKVKTNQTIHRTQ